MSKNNFKLCAFFSLVAFSSTSYSMLKATRPQISTTTLIALRHCATATPQANELQNVEVKKNNYSDTRIHPEDMAELKAHISSNRSHINYFWVGYACMLACLIAAPHTKSDLENIRNRQNQILYQLNSIKNKP